MPGLQFQVKESYRSTKHCALVDANGWFDLMSAETTGIDLSCVLWVRCAKRHKRLNLAEQAFKAADILLQHGEFKSIIVDLSRVPERQIRSISLTTWHRFSRAAEKTSTNLIFLTSVSVAQSCANLKVHITQSVGTWTDLQQLSQSGQINLPHAHVISGVESQCEIVREKLRKSIQSVNATFPQLSKRA